MKDWNVGASVEYMRGMGERYARDPLSVGVGWRAFFDEVGAEGCDEASWTRGREDLGGDMKGGGEWWGEGGVVGMKAARKEGLGEEELKAAASASMRAMMLVRAHRILGHMAADLDPLGMMERGRAELEASRYGFEEGDKDKVVYLDGVLGMERATIRELEVRLQEVYCGRLGCEYMHVSEPERRAWLRDWMEGGGINREFTPEGRRAILWKVMEAEGFESFLATKYMGTKRFGLDGGESLVPALEKIIKEAGAGGVRDIVLGTPHRGRLTMLTLVMGKRFEAMFNEFSGGDPLPAGVEGSGDVKYHLGASSDREFDGHSVHLSLAANPSHLESVGPVVLGKARAKQDKRGVSGRGEVMPLLVHGDAAFAGQGVVAECFGLSGLGGHGTGGAVHVVVNNQIGFTTSPLEGRSSRYPSDVAKMVDTPIFHANGGDPESVVRAAEAATQYRIRFGCSALVDMICYRRNGHNEIDEPRFTQPLMYERIGKSGLVSEGYGRRLVEEGVVSEEEVEEHRAEFRGMLDVSHKGASTYRVNKADWLEGEWKGLKPAPLDGDRRGDTGVEEVVLREVGEALTRIPEGFGAHKGVRRVMERRAASFTKGEGIDWAFAEALAFGTLLREDMDVRLSGQDCERGTFSQRHAALVDQRTEEKYVPLSHVGGEGKFHVVNSMLSELAVLGFEYGYSLSAPSVLVLWEAQFGDFANGAQIIIDQFISSGEKKWLRMSGLVLLLPHGYEGQGPEHSSARLERFLQMSAQDNWQVANCTTPANYFHILRRQKKRGFRKPLILMTPKSLLRDKDCVSSLSEFMSGSSLHRIFWDDQDKRLGGKLRDAKDIRKVFVCTGKVYYEVKREREKRGLDDVYLLRLEELYPFPKENVVKELARFGKKAEIMWLQEEPRNMGAWGFVKERLEEALEEAGRGDEKLRYVGRKEAASPATGTYTRHEAQKAALMEEVFG